MKNLALLSLLVLMFACTESASELDALEVDWNLAKNLPVSSNVPHAYSYVLYADDFSADNEIQLQFDTTSFIFSLTVVGYESGSMEVAIYNQDTTETFERIITSSTVISEFPPFNARYLHVILDGFTGQVNLALTEDD